MLGHVWDICFDTGTLFYPSALRALAARPGVRLWGSTTNVFETVSDVVDEVTFVRARAQMRLLLDVSGPRFLPDTDTQFRMYIAHPEVIDDPYEWLNVAQRLASAESFPDAAQKLDFDRAREMRRRHTEGWVDRVIEEMFRSVNPGLRVEPDWHSRAEPAMVADLKAFLHSPLGRNAQVDAWFERQGWEPSQFNLKERAAAFVVLRAYLQAHEGFMLHVLEFGRKPEANDALDLDQLLPLWQSGWYFLSSDKRLIRCLELGEMESNRYRLVQTLDVAEWLGIVDAG
jgi:hypothetical protein